MTTDYKYQSICWQMEGVLLYPKKYKETIISSLRTSKIINNENLFLNMCNDPNVCIADLTTMFVEKAPYGFIINLPLHNGYDPELPLILRTYPFRGWFFYRQPSDKYLRWCVDNNKLFEIDIPQLSNSIKEFYPTDAVTEEEKFDQVRFFLLRAFLFISKTVTPLRHRLKIRQREAIKRSVLNILKDSTKVKQIINEPVSM
ncbi:MAG: hypothetical protein QW303_01970 [Nitrososphaerota archaeon]